MKLLLKTWSTNENFNGDCDYAAVDLTPELATILERRITQFKILKQAETSLDTMVYWDASADMLGWTEEIEEVADPDKENVFEVPDSFVFGEPQRTECDRVEVTDTGVRFTCYPKHCDCRIESAELRLEVIERAIVGHIAAETVRPKTSKRRRC
jgi:hypothetical protein